MSNIHSEVVEAFDVAKSMILCLGHENGMTKRTAVGAHGLAIL